MKAFVQEEGDAVLGESISVMESLNRLRKTGYLGLYRKAEEIYFGMSATPICYAAYTGNVDAVRYLLSLGAPKKREGLNSYFEAFNNELIGTSQGCLFCCTILYQSDPTYRFENENFEDVDPIGFTFPEGRIDCLRLFLEAGHKIDLRSRSMLRMLSLCRDQSFWEYLLEHRILDPNILVIAAEYAAHYRNELAKWLLNTYMQLRKRG